MYRYSGRTQRKASTWVANLLEGPWLIGSSVNGNQTAVVRGDLETGTVKVIQGHQALATHEVVQGITAWPGNTSRVNQEVSDFRRPTFDGPNTSGAEVHLSTKRIAVILRQDGCEMQGVVRGRVDFQSFSVGVGKCVGVWTDDVEEAARWRSPTLAGSRQQVESLIAQTQPAIGSIVIGEERMSDDQVAMQCEAHCIQLAHQVGLGPGLSDHFQANAEGLRQQPHGQDGQAQSHHDFD